MNDDISKINVGILLLAAGSSSRMGQPKQLLEIGNKPLLLHTTHVALKSRASFVTVVLGANSNHHKQLIHNLPVNIIINEEWQRGMGSSIKAGVNHLSQQYKSLQGIIILVCDQPLLTHQHINALIDKHLETQQPIVASRYIETLGVPVFFSHTMFNDLLLLNDTNGAKQILGSNASSLSHVDFPDGEIDLDTLSDYQNYIKNHSPHSQSI